MVGGGSGSEGQQWKVVGIVSFGPAFGQCGNAELPGVYTRVDKYINWITGTIIETK